MAQLFILGLGYAAGFIRAAANARGWQVTGTGSGGEVDFQDEEAVRASLASATHVLSSVPPSEAEDPVLARYGDALAPEVFGGWLGYLSSTGVYGDTAGAWVDESAPTVRDGVGTGRRTARAEADAAWLARGARVFRLPGIYGPPSDGHEGRSALARVREGRAHRIDLPQQVFSRIHVEDIATAVLAAFDAPPGAYNLADDLPASQNAVIEEACRLLGRPPPPLLSLEEAGLSPQARAFYGENRRIANGKARRVLGWRPLYPDYRAGLLACLGSGPTGGPAASAPHAPAAR